MVKQSFISRAKGKASRYAMRSTGLVQNAYFTFFSSAFGRERRAVAAGIRRHGRVPQFESTVFRLRKSIHTLEKGLSMKPRRPIFGLTLIGPAMTDYRIVQTEWPDRLGDAEARWMRSVLTEYFEATSTSEDPRTLTAKKQFADLHGLSPDDGPFHGPAHPPAWHDALPSAESILALAHHRGSVRWYEDRPVAREAVDLAITVGAQSPTACNRQPYRYYIFDDPKSIDLVSAVPMGTRGWRHQIPGLMVLVGDLSAYVDERDRHLIYIDAALSAQATLFGFESQGIASCVINWPDITFREKSMAELLDLKPYERVIMLIAYGYADPEGLVPFSGKKEIHDAREYRSL